MMLEEPETKYETRLGNDEASSLQNRKRSLSNLLFLKEKNPKSQRMNLIQESHEIKFGMNLRKEKESNQRRKRSLLLLLFLLNMNQRNQRMTMMLEEPGTKFETSLGNDEASSLQNRKRS